VGTHRPADLTMPAEIFVHEALYYRDLAEFYAGTAAFVRAGFDSDEPVLIAVPEPRLALLRGELSGAGGRVRFVDMAVAGRNPNRILPWVLRAFAAEHRPRRVRIIGEPIYVGRTPDEVASGVQHEALINVAFAGVDAAILCPYDIERLALVDTCADLTHPVIVSGGERRESSSYTDPYTLVASLNQPLPEPVRVDETLVFDAQGLAAVRRLVGKHADGVGLAADSVADLQLAVTEICTNAVTHTGSAVATLRVWSEGDKVVSEIRGAGEIADVMAGRAVPSLDNPRGRGLLIANRLCDLVQTFTAPTGTVTRLHMRLSPT